MDDYFVGEALPGLKVAPHWSRPEVASLPLEDGAAEIYQLHQLLSSILLGFFLSHRVVHTSPLGRSRVLFFLASLHFLYCRREALMAIFTGKLGKR
jgi:hypothetical protein